MLPEISRSIIKDFDASMTQLLLGSASAVVHEAPPNVLTISGEDATGLETIPDSTDVVYIRRPTTIRSSLTRLDRPLYIVTSGLTVIAPESRLRGLVAVVSAGEILLQKGATIDNAILYSQKSAHVSSFSRAIGQIIAPAVTLDSGAVMMYPSLVASTTSLTGSSLGQGIALSGTASVEGFLGLISSGGPLKDDDIVSIGPTGSVVGTAISESRFTLDGTVTGTVIAKDFYFYLAPTIYVGWLRSGVLNRSLLPPGYLLPPILAGSVKLDVMRWLQ